MEFQVQVFCHGFGWMDLFVTSSLAYAMELCGEETVRRKADMRVVDDFLHQRHLERYVLPVCNSESMHCPVFWVDEGF